MQQFTLGQMYHPNQSVYQSDHYQHYADTAMPLMYDRNFIRFNINPEMTDFKKAESYLKRYQQQQAQEHLRFVFPDNQLLTPELETYLRGQHYDLGRVELYGIHPADYPVFQGNPEIVITRVSSEHLKRYLFLHYWQDVAYGQDFAHEKEIDYKQRFENPHIIQLLALHYGEPVGSVDVIVRKEAVEIDNLFVEATYRNQGVGKMLQTYVMRLAADKHVLLVADGNETVRDMYQQQQYQCLAFRYDAVKSRSTSK